VNIEPRLSGGGRLEVTFEIEMDPVTATDPDHVSIVGVNSGPYAGSVNVSLDGTGTVVIIEPLGSLPEADCYTVDLTGMLSKWGAGPMHRTFEFVALTGDSDLNGLVDSADADAVRQRLGRIVVTSIVRFDVNHDGSISTADLASVKQRLGSTAPPCP
ncbi:MAG TPA: dockerin type I domain-containing protein, partial [Thermoguttaceae bacterium]|nr:dockerin type I domain-containing protein [Thermoguttaceae bacterium]